MRREEAVSLDLYRVKEKIHKKLDCNLLVVTSEHVILCQVSLSMGKTMNFSHVRAGEEAATVQLQWREGAGVGVGGGDPVHQGEFRVEVIRRE